MSTTITPYLHFPGTAREAFTFYESALGGHIDAMIRYADMPMPPPPEGCAPEGAPVDMGDGIMHACITLPGGARLYAGDAHPSQGPHEGFKGSMLALEYDTVDEAKAAFEALAAGGKTTMPMMPMPWAKIFGMVTDRFGVDWAVNGESIPMN